MAQQGDVQVHHRACVEGRPDPVELAARLVDLELASELDGFYRAAAEYAEVLGEAGLAVYRERLEPQWKRIGHGAGDWSDNAFAVRQALAGWAIGTGDPDALIEVHGRDRILPGNVLEIALALDAAGRSDEAVAWARRGIAEHGDTRWQAGDLREFLAGALRGRGEAQAAAELFWQAFVSHPSLATYRRLLDEAAVPRSGADKPEQSDNLAEEAARRQRLVKLRAPAVESLTAECMEVRAGHGRPPTQSQSRRRTMSRSARSRLRERRRTRAGLHTL